MRDLGVGDFAVQLFQAHGLLLGCDRRILYLMFLEVCILRLYVFRLLLLVDLLALPKKALGFDLEAAFAHGHGGVQSGGWRRAALGGVSGFS